MLAGNAELLQHGLCSHLTELWGCLSCVSLQLQQPLPVLCVLKSFITSRTVCVEINFCWRTKLQYLPINYQDVALRFFVVHKCLKYQNIQEDYY